jgi:branched-subunit amino acid transport protein AzlD
VNFSNSYSYMCSIMHIGLCIVSTKSTSKLKFWILKTGNKKMTRTGITQTLPSKFMEGLTMFFKCLLNLHSLTFRIELSLISPCQHKTPRMLVHSSTCFILSTTMVAIGKWAFKLTRLAGNSSQPFSSFVNS